MPWAHLWADTLRTGDNARPIERVSVSLDVRVGQNSAVTRAGSMTGDLKGRFMTVTNVDVLDGQQPPPPGWIKDPTDLNAGAGGDYLYLTFERDGTMPPVTDVYILDDGVTPPPMYEKIDVDLNKGAGGDYLYLCFTRQPGNPILDFKVIASSEANPNPPAGYKRAPTDLNKGAGGKYIYLCYKN